MQKAPVNPPTYELDLHDAEARSISLWCATARRLADWTIKDLALATDISAPILKHYESGSRGAPQRVAEVIIGAFGRAGVQVRVTEHLSVDGPSFDIVVARKGVRF